LTKAYIDARYKRDYVITEEELENYEPGGFSAIARRLSAATPPERMNVISL
jgi:hypothetical protein